MIIPKEPKESNATSTVSTPTLLPITSAPEFPKSTTFNINSKINIFNHTFLHNQSKRKNSNIRIKNYE